jgi:multicomponent Na+:H+ antiporter subunit A
VTRLVFHTILVWSLFLLFSGHNNPGGGFAAGLVGGEVLQSWIFDVHLPLLGDLHLVTSLFFDIGVYLVVIGFALDVLSSLGAAIDRQIDEEVSA